MISLDTNLLVYAHRAGVPEHQRAKQVIEDALNHPAGCAVALPCVSEFWMVVTHTRSSTKPSRPSQARAFLAGLFSAGVSVLYPKAGLAEHILTIAAELDLQGQKIFDLQIALISKQAGARELWTHDANFPAIPGLIVRYPL